MNGDQVECAAEELPPGSNTMFSTSFIANKLCFKAAMLIDRGTAFFLILDIVKKQQCTMLALLTNKGTKTNFAFLSLHYVFSLTAPLASKFLIEVYHLFFSNFKFGINIYILKN